MGFHYDHDTERIRRRYDRLAAIYPIFEVMFALPRGIRGKAVQRLGLREGDSVLEIGCGTGRTFAYLTRAVGHEGRVYGVDCSDGMLARARKRCHEKGWSNVELLQEDAENLSFSRPVDGVLFSLSYCVIPNSERALQRSWSILREGGRLVILDSPIPHGRAWKLLRPFISFLSRATVLGDPDATPSEDLRKLTSNIQKEEFQLGTYIVLCGTKCK